MAAVSGVLAFQDDLSDMRDTVDLNELNQTQLRRGQESAAHTERAMITSGLPATSGGINTSALQPQCGRARAIGSRDHAGGKYCCQRSRQDRG